MRQSHLYLLPVSFLLTKVFAGFDPSSGQDWADLKPDVEYVPGALTDYPSLFGIAVTPYTLDDSGVYLKAAHTITNKVEVVITTTSVSTLPKPTKTIDVIQQIHDGQIQRTTTTHIRTGAPTHAPDPDLDEDYEEGELNVIDGNSDEDQEDQEEVANVDEEEISEESETIEVEEEDKKEETEPAVQQLSKNVPKKKVAQKSTKKSSKNLKTVAKKAPKKSARKVSKRDDADEEVKEAAPSEESQSENVNVDEKEQDSASDGENQESIIEDESNEDGSEAVEWDGSEEEHEVEENNDDSVSEKEGEEEEEQEEEPQQKSEEGPVLAVACVNDSTLSMSLQGSVLKDSLDRIGSIVESRQFQFDGPVPQFGAIYAAGWSITPEGHLALGNETKFYQCASGEFYNLYDLSIGSQCNPVTLDVVDLIQCD